MKNKKYHVEVYLKKDKHLKPLMEFYVTSLDKVIVNNFDYFFLVSEVPYVEN